MFAERPDGIAGGREAVLKDAGVGGLAFSIGTYVEHAAAGEPGISGGVSEYVVDGDAGKVFGAKHIDGAGTVCASRKGSGAEGLFVVGVVLFAQEPEGLLSAEVGLHEVGVDDGEDLSAGVEMFGEAGDTGVGVGRERGIVLVVVLERDGVLGGGVVVEVGCEHVRLEFAGSGQEGVKRVRGRERTRGDVIGDKPLAGFAREGR